MSKWLVVKAGFRTSKSNQQNLILEQIRSESTKDFRKKNLEKSNNLVKKLFPKKLDHLCEKHCKKRNTS